MIRQSAIEDVMDHFHNQNKQILYSLNTDNMILPNND